MSADKAPTSKIIQISRFVEKGTGWDYLIALCEDGSLWQTLLGNPTLYWECLSIFNGEQYEHGKR